MSATDLPREMMSLQSKEEAILYSCYMPFLGHGGLFVPTGDIFSPGDEVLSAMEVIDHPKKFLRMQVAWTNPARTSAHHPKGIKLTFGTDEVCIQTKRLIETEPGNALRSDGATFAP